MESAKTPVGRADVCVVGLGYIGLPTAVFFAQQLEFVAGVDTNQERVDAVNRGKLPFVEPGLSKLLASAIEEGSMHAYVETVPAKNYIVSVPTPVDTHKRVNLDFVRAAVDSIADHLVGDELIVLESTCPPGTTEEMQKWVLDIRPDLKDTEICFAHCPERVLPGNIVNEMRANDRVVGGLTKEASFRASQLYSVFCEGEILQTEAKTAEMTKLTENAFRDVNIAFANELSIICDKLEIDVWELINLANRHPRVNVLRPGPGVGGHCIAVDPWFIVSALPNFSPLIRTAREVNTSKPTYVTERIVEAAFNFESPEIAVLGISFKANVDDTRQSPAIQIVGDMAVKLPASSITVFDPLVADLPSELRTYPNVSWSDQDFRSTDFDLVVLLVDHDEFRQFKRIDFSDVIFVDVPGAIRK